MDIAEKIRGSQKIAAMLKRSLDTLVRLYTDKTHFVYELLQNAEDAEATTVRFIMHNDCLEFIHNGLPFTESNASAICDAANSDKVNLNSDGNTQIGKFGVGFKAVFAICDTVKLFSEPSHRPIADALPRFAFEIQNYTTPVNIEAEWKIDTPYTTRFIFPFNHEGRYEMLEDLKVDLSAKLTQLGAEVMLYLKYIETIEYEIDEDDNMEASNGVYMLERKDIGAGCTKITTMGESGQSDHASTYLMYSKSNNEKGKTVDLVFTVADDDSKIRFIDADEKHKFISVYFPTKKESKLKFMIQAPFSTTPNRENIPNSAENRQLVEAAAELLRDVVADVKRRGWLSLDFLNILPWEKQSSDWLLNPLYNKSIEMFENDEILPTIDGGFASAQDAKIAGSGDLTKFFEREKLCALIGNKNAKWMPTHLTESSATLSLLHGFLTKTIGVEEIIPAKIPARLRDTSQLWKVVNDEWLVRFYNWLAARQLDLIGQGRGLLATVPFIKTTDGDYAPAYEYDNRTKVWSSVLYRFPKNASRVVGGFRFVDEYIAEHCPDFLKAMDINVPVEYDYLVADLNERYKDRAVTEKDELSHIKRALKFLRDDSGEEIVLEFRSKLWLRYINVVSGDTELNTAENVTLYFAQDNKCGICIIDYLLGIKMQYGIVGVLDEEFYTANGISRQDLLFLKRLNLQDTIISYGDDTFYVSNRQCRNLANFRRDLTFSFVNEVLNSISPKKSQILWRLLNYTENHLSGEWMFGAVGVSIQKDVSSIIKTLRDKAWLYNKEGRVVYPRDITRNELDTALYGRLDPDSRLYNILEFREDQGDVAVQIIKNLPRDDLLRVIEQIASIKEEETVYDPDLDENLNEFPQEGIPDLERLISTTKAAYRAARPVKYEHISMSIRTSRSSNDRQQVRLRYEGFCQMCGRPSKYREIAELKKSPTKELPQMNLSLCPNCATQYREYRNNDSIMRNFENNIKSASYVADKPQAQLEGETTICFTKAHLAEIQTILTEMENE